MPWYPLYDALRLFFTVEQIGLIQSESEYQFALSGIHHIESEFFDYMEEIDLQVFIPQAEALIASKFSGEKDRDDLLAMIARFDGSAYIYTPPEIVFEGSSGGLEAPFTEWLNAFMVTPLFDDEFDGEGSSLEFNLQSLIERWNRRPLQERSPYGDKIWHIIAINTPVQFNYEEKLITFEIHKISQLADPDIGLDPAIPTNPEIHYKITLFRTGERHEYDADMDRSLLAVQVIIASENLKCPVKEIEADIDWLRLDERDYPLVGLSEEELHSISHQYLLTQ
jgi:hypothetical protein